MLDHHPRFRMLSEFEYSVDQVNDPVRWPDLSAYDRYLALHRIYNRHGFRIDPSLDYPQRIRDFLRQFAGDAQVVGATVHKHYDRLLRIWPEARFIKLLRDARDVARSSVQMNWACNPWFGVQRWIDAEQIWDQFTEMVPADRRIVVRYEDLIANHEIELSRICEFMGDRFEPAIYDYAKNSTYELPDPKLIYQWKRKMSQYDIQLVESRIADMLVKRGYELSGYPRITVSSVAELRMRVHNRWFIMRARQKKYGYALWLKHFLASRSGLHQWRKSTQLRINNIDQSFIK